MGARLFLSPRRVEHHLHKVFTKLDITSREHLDRMHFGARDSPSLRAKPGLRRVGD
ncbi:MAG: hypothetical protein JO325_22010 [Solirubrobacterales bacterium]|nr:hypothetical protein [Solirubrobacterales bacterium]